MIEHVPESASALRRVLASAHRAGDGARIRTVLDRLAAMGYALSVASLDMLSAHLPADESARLRRRFDENRETLGSSRLVDSIPADRRLVEGIAVDSRNRRLFASSVVGRELLVRDAETWRRVDGLETGSLFGMAVDRRRGLLWLASGSAEQTPPAATAYRGLIALRLDNLQVVRRIGCGPECSPGDLTVGRDGTVYASDPASGAVYHARPADVALSPLIPPGHLRSPQGLALSADERRLYVADYAFGIAVVDIGGRGIARLGADVVAMLDGIDGLVAYRGDLVAIQNGTNPRRILHLRLSRDGSRVARVDVLERANPEWGEPTLGSISGGELLYVADAQWERYGPAGAIRGDGPTRPTAIRALRLPARAGR